MSSQAATVAKITQVIQRVSRGIGMLPPAAARLSQMRMATAPKASASLAAMPSTAILTDERSVASTGMNACSQMDRCTDERQRQDHQPAA